MIDLADFLVCSFGVLLGFGLGWAFTRPVETYPARPVVDEEELIKLAREWRHLARRKFTDADAESSEFAARFIRHGGWCYYNCFRAVEDLVSQPIVPSDILEAEKKSKKRLV